VLEYPKKQPREAKHSRNHCDTPQDSGRRYNQRAVLSVSEILQQHNKRDDAKQEEEISDALARR
jgi:hypothetical protein